MWWISIGCGVFHQSFQPLSHGAIILELNYYLKYVEENNNFPFTNFPIYFLFLRIGFFQTNDYAKH